MSSIWILLFLMIVSFIAGIVIGRMFKADEIDVESALEFLRSRGYWVRLNVGPGDKHEFDEVTGRKKKSSLLNKKKLRKEELDELFMGDG